jgi:hypothetical protein
MLRIEQFGLEMRGDDDVASSPRISNPHCSITTLQYLNREGAVTISNLHIAFLV